MSEILFNIEVCPESGGFVARWDDPKGGGITTQGDDLAELHRMIADAVKGYFELGDYPRQVRLHFSHYKIMPLLRSWLNFWRGRYYKYGAPLELGEAVAERVVNGSATEGALPTESLLTNDSRMRPRLRISNSHFDVVGRPS